MGKVQTMKCPLVSKSYMGAEAIGNSDKLEYLLNGYITKDGTLRKRPGLTRVAHTDEADADSCSLIYKWENNGTTYTKLVSAIGATIYSRNLTGTVSIAKIATSYTSTMRRNYATRAGVLDGGTVKSSLFITSNKSAPIYTFPIATPSFSAISDADCPAGTSGAPLESSLAFLDGYLLASAHGAGTSARFSWSNIPNAATTWESTSSAEAMGSPDGLLRMLVIDRQIWLFGQQSIEIWENDGTTPFSRVSGGFLDRGISDSNAVTVCNGMVYIVDNQFNFGKIENGIFKRIQIPYWIQSNLWTSLAKERLLTSIVIDQREMVVVSLFTVGGKGCYTYIYDPDLDSWSRWTLKDSNANYLLATERAMGIVTACQAGSQYVGLCGDVYGGVHTLSEDSNNDLPDVAGELTRPILFQVRSGHIDYGTLRPKRSHEFRLRVARGNHIVKPADATIQFCDDRETYWGPYNIDLGANNENDIVYKFQSGGIFRTRQYIIQSNNEAEFHISGAEEDIEVL